jgi:hypothetical protein
MCDMKKEVILALFAVIVVFVVIGLIIYSPGEEITGRVSVDGGGGKVPAVLLRFEEGAGAREFVDSTGNGNEGTCRNLARCPFSGGRGLEFDGVDDYLDLDDEKTVSNPTFDDPVEKRSVSLCYKAERGSGTQILYEEGGSEDGLNIYLSGGKVWAGAWSEHNLWDGEWIGTESGLVGEWHHVAYSFNALELPAGKLRLYYDGSKAAEVSVLQPVASHLSRDLMGATEGRTKVESGDVKLGYPSLFFKGGIDDFYVYDSVLTDSEIGSLARECLGEEERLIECFKENDCGNEVDRVYCEGDESCSEKNVFACNDAGTFDASCSGSERKNCKPCSEGCEAETGMCKVKEVKLSPCVDNCVVELEVITIINDTPTYHNDYVRFRDLSTGKEYDSEILNEGVASLEFNGDFYEVDYLASPSHTPNFNKYVVLRGPGVLTDGEVYHGSTIEVKVS